MSLHTIDKRLNDLGIILPDPPGAVGNYIPVNVQNGIGYVSGQFPLVNGRLSASGIIGDDLEVEEAREAVRIAAVNVLAQIKKAVGSWDNLLSLARVDGYFVAGINIVNHPKILDTASDLFVDVLGEKGVHARTVFGVCNLPMNAPVELVVQFYTKGRLSE